MTVIIQYAINCKHIGLLHTQSLIRAGRLWNTPPRSGLLIYKRIYFIVFFIFASKHNGYNDVGNMIQ